MCIPFLQIFSLPFYISLKMHVLKNYLPWESMAFTHHKSSSYNVSTMSLLKGTYHNAYILDAGISFVDPSWTRWIFIRPVKIHCIKSTPSLLHNLLLGRMRIQWLDMAATGDAGYHQQGSRKKFKGLRNDDIRIIYSLALLLLSKFPSI
jgi:hypothetical protein